MLKTLVKDLHEAVEAEDEAWDKQIEEDAKAGKLDRFVEKALENFRADRYYEIEDLQKLCGTHIRGNYKFTEPKTVENLSPNG